MLEFDGGAAAGAPDDLIKDGSEMTFMEDVIDASQSVPVIVDFWATWCGPCKTLGPALEEAVLNARGKVKLVKIDVDQNQQIAGQLRIQSIPTVYAFFEGKPVDAFQGALSGSEIKAFIDKLIGLAGGEDGDGLGEALEMAETMLSEGAAVDAAETFAAILSQDPASSAAYGGLVRAHLALDELDKAEALLDAASEEITGTPEFDAARAQLELLRQAANSGPEAELRQQVEAEPDNHQARFDLATTLMANGNAEDAIEELLELFRRDRNWNDEAAKTQLFTIFDSLKPNDPIAQTGRRRLSSMIFA